MARKSFLRLGRQLSPSCWRGALPSACLMSGALANPALFENEKNVRAVYARGSLVSYQSVLESPYVYAPHDVIVPRAIAAGDLPILAEALAPRKLRLVRQVDGQNRLVKPQEPDEPSPA